MLSVGGASAFDAYDPQEQHSDGEEAEDAEAANPLLGPEEGRYPANLRIFFPSRLMGARNALLYQRWEVKRQADIHCTVTGWHSECYPVACFRDLLFPRLRSASQPAPFCHSKFVFRMVGAAERARAAQAGQCAAFVYVGSHNMSKTAWGFNAGPRRDVLKVEGTAAFVCCFVDHSFGRWAKKSVCDMLCSSSTQCCSFELGVLLATRDFAEADEWRAALPFDLQAPRYRPDDAPFTTHSQHMGSRYGDPSKPKSMLIRELLKLGFGEDEARNAVDAAHGNGALAFSMLTIARRLQ